MKKKSRFILFILFFSMFILIMACHSAAIPSSPDLAQNESQAVSMSNAAAEGIGSSKGENFSGALEACTITFSHCWMREIPEGDIISLYAAVEKFQADHPEITLHVDAMPHDNYLIKIKTLAAGNALSDINAVNGSMTKNFTSNELLLALDSLLENNREWSSRFLQESFHEFTVDGSIYGIPRYWFSTHVLFYNDAIFKNCGIHEFPRNWDELLDAAEQLKAHGYIPMLVGNKGQWPIESTFFSTLADRFTGTEWTENIINQTGNASFTDPEFVASLQFVSDLVSKGFFNDNAQMFDNISARYLFANEQAAMMSDGAWAIGPLTQITPDEVLDSIRVTIMPGGVPGQKGSDQAVSGGSGWSIGVSSEVSVSQQAAILELFKYIWSDESVVLSLENGGQPAYQFDLKTVELDPLSEQYFNVMQNVEFTPIYDIQLESSLVDIIYQGLQEMMIERTTPEILAEKLQAEQEALMRGQ